MPSKNSILISNYQKQINYKRRLEKMNDLEITKELILMLLPLIAIDFGLKIYCIIKIFTEGVENLNQWAWLAICMLVNLFGPIAFLIAGRKRG